MLKIQRINKYIDLVKFWLDLAQIISLCEQIAIQPVLNDRLNHALDETAFIHDTTWCKDVDVNALEIYLSVKIV